MEVKDKNLFMTRGDTESIVSSMTVDGEPKPFEPGDTVTFTMRYKKRDEEVIAFQASVTEFDENGKAIIGIPHEATANLKAGRYAYDIQCVDSEGNYMTIIGGKEDPAYITLWQDVTW